MRLYKSLHPTQQKILYTLQNSTPKPFPYMSLREWSRMLLNEESPQKMQHHLFQLVKKGMIEIDENRCIKLLK